MVPRMNEAELAQARAQATGIRDQVESNRDYGSGFWAQQWLGLKRLVGRA